MSQRYLRYCEHGASIDIDLPKEVVEPIPVVVEGVHCNGLEVLDLPSIFWLVNEPIERLVAVQSKIQFHNNC